MTWIFRSPPLALALAFVLVVPAEAQQRTRRGTPAKPAGLALATDPTISDLVAAISIDRLGESLARLVTFGTRHTLSDTMSPTRGIGAARRYIHQTFERFSADCGGCLDVSYDAHDVVVTRHPQRPTVRVVNVIAKLHGRTDPDRVLLVMAHYDSCICALDRLDATSDAPGADDDGSGTAVVVELARVFTQRFPQGLDASVWFVAVAGEEMGLLGSTALAERLAAEPTLQLAAVITNDIVGNVRAHRGGVDSTRVRVFSGEPGDGPSRQLARYARAAAETYVAGVEVDPIDRLDRIGGGGGHRPFWERGRAAIRFTESIENELHQHRPEDRIEHVSFAYMQKVARVNAATVASLALAPRAPEGVWMERLVDSGGVDWRVSWQPVPNAPDLAGYELTVRRTTEPFASRVIPIGDVTTHILADTQADDVWLGVRAVDRDGHVSLVRSLHQAPSRPGNTQRTPSR